MKARWIALLGGSLLVGALILAGVGIAQAMSANGQTPAGWGPMMNGYGSNGNGSGGMMNGNGMMNGYGSGQTQQNPSSGTPVTGDTVTIRNFAFQPANLGVKVGMMVTWTNQDTTPHTVTFRDNSLKSSGILRQSDTYSYTFTKTGVFTYYCDLHDYMTAQVTVTA